MQKTVAQRWIDHYLEAASSQAEEVGDQRSFDIIERAKRELEATRKERARAK
ncbi:hypothetical protein [Bradyrhizobium sacchari]|uniref:Uncharacterized protein n=1 Tax=Bradyrhizobium sacchari TaxID=1399419 RepID=A0A560K598_9BRAD|nr:hypothetical protein [Bradyrhizobium sacchari]TWB54070.1 hypothetical protein FBZ94_108358 [Bradyrhizobium sacchari]TWB78518.1 hypothetical protein FBZ95_103358 [Bradyrhizobium sacchari]